MLNNEFPEVILSWYPSLILDMPVILNRRENNWIGDYIVEVIDLVISSKLSVNTSYI